MSEKTMPGTPISTAPKVVFHRMIAALNRHDLEAMVACFSPAFRSEQPFHPERAFSGPDGVRRNWSFFFTNVPDIQAEILREAVNENMVWAEIHFHGTELDGKSHSTRGVTISEIQENLITRTHLYIETVIG